MRPWLPTRTVARPLAPLPPARFYNARRNQRSLEIGLQRRSFHVPDGSAVIDSLVSLSHGFLQTTHSVSGLPWVVSIPLAAIAFRLVVGATLQRATFVDAGKRARLMPLFISWRRLHEKQVLDKSREANSFAPPTLVKVQAAAAFEAKKKELNKRWKVRWWGPYHVFAQFPFWLAILESLRRMAGMPVGLLGVIQTWFYGPPSESVIPLEPSMAAEGALWFPDLLAPDPYCALPVILSSVLLVSINTGFKVKSAEEIAELAKLSPREALKARARKGLKLTLNALALSIAPTCIRAQVPAGLLIFWITSSSFATLQNTFMHKWYIVPSPKPCTDKAIGGRRDER